LADHIFILGFDRRGNIDRSATIRSITMKLSNFINLELLNPVNVIIIIVVAALLPLMITLIMMPPNLDIGGSSHAH
jgi:hypothetical protein